jgi:hypothetical protein
MVEWSHTTLVTQQGVPMKAVITADDVSFRDLEEMPRQFGGLRLFNGTGSVLFGRPTTPAKQGEPIIVYDLTNLKALRKYVAERGWKMTVEE